MQLEGRARKSLMDGLPSQNTRFRHCSSNIAQRNGRTAIDASTRMISPAPSRTCSSLRGGDSMMFLRVQRNACGDMGSSRTSFEVLNVRRADRLVSAGNWPRRIRRTYPVLSERSFVTPRTMTCSSPFHDSIRRTRNCSDSERGSSYRLMR